MLFNNRMRPAFATAGVAKNHSVQRTERNEALSFSTNTEADDFGAFTSDQTRERAPKRERPASAGKKPAKKGSSRTLIIAIVAVVAVVLLCVVIGALILNSSKDIVYTNNTYLAYVEDNGNYRVAVNGKTLDDVFYGTTRVIPSLDRSFAYVECNATGGYQLYLLEGKKLTPLTTENSAVTEVIAYAQCAPGVLFYENGRVCLYNDVLGTRKVDNNAEAANFLISDDATRVVYTRPSPIGEGLRVYLFDGSSAPIEGLKNCIPVQLSADGKYLYAYGDTESQPRKLYCITTEDGKKSPVCEANFGGITAMNVAGDEIIYYTLSDTKITASVYSYKQKLSFEIAKDKGIFSPVGNGEIARYATFADCYFESSPLLGDVSEDGTQVLRYTYHINKKFDESKSIIKATGKFSPDGKYFYYLHPTTKFLYQVDLSDLTKDHVKIYTDDSVIDFAITQKGNLYILDSSQLLVFRKPTSLRNERISMEATAISMHQYANQIYFTELEDVNIYVSKEGSAPEIAKFGESQLEALPEFNTGDIKRTYAYFYTDIGCSLYYSANGKTFKKASNECANVVTEDGLTWIPELEIPSVNTGNNNTNTGTGTTPETNNNNLAG